MKAAAIYARVSTEEQVKNTSLRGQTDACKEHATQLGYTVTKEISEDFSGARLDRPGLDDIRDMASRGEIAALIVYEADRLSRKVGHLLLLEEELARHNVLLIFVNGQEDTSSPEGRMFFTMRGAFGEFERTKIIERMRLGKLRAARSGKIIGNRCVPLGYDLVDGEYVIVPDEAQIVRQIFEWMVYARMTLRQIGIRLTEMGVSTKQGSTRWIPNSVKAILNNETYAGTFYWNKTVPVLPKTRRTEGPHKQEKTSKRRRDRSEWIAIACPAIITDELFQAAQKQLQQNKEQSPRNSKRSYLLRGLMKCALCGYGFYGHAATSSRVYYYCAGKTNREIYRPNYTGELCPQRYLRADALEQRVWEFIKAQITDEEKLVATFDQRDQVQEHERRRDEGELEALYSAEERLNKEQNKMLDLYAQEIIDVTQLQERLADIRKRREGVSEAKSEVLARTEGRKAATGNIAVLREYCSLVRRGIEYAAANKSQKDYRREFLEMLETQITIDAHEIHISGVITGKLPVVEANNSGEEHAYPLSSTDGHRLCRDDTAAGGGR